MAVIKADVCEAVKQEFKQVAKDSKKHESECLRQAIQNYIATKKATKVQK